MGFDGNRARFPAMNNSFYFPFFPPPLSVSLAEQRRLYSQSASQRLFNQSTSSFLVLVIMVVVL